MKPNGEIDPELYGLLDEVVRDPRSSLRLTPRKALSRWFDGGERVGARGVSLAEKHLLEVHREALAALLIQASRVAYWKASDLGIVARRADGSRPFTRAEPAELPSRIQAALRAVPAVGCPELAALVHREPIRSEALSLASAALALVPSDEARHAVAVATPWDQPRSAVALLERLNSRAKDPDRRVCVLSAMGARLCALNKLADAHQAYVSCRGLSELSAIQEYCVLNLSCYLTDEAAAATAARELARNGWVQLLANEQRGHFTRFAHTQDPTLVKKARAMALRFASGSAAAQSVMEALT